MRRPLRSLVPFAALAALSLTTLSACSLLVDFDEEGQPCDERNQCLEGFTCQDEKCVSDDSPASDAGVDAGTGADAGVDAGG